MFLQQASYTPSFGGLGLKHKSRHGAKVHKVYDSARTPYQRVLESGVLTPEHQDVMAQQYQRLNPVKILAQINQALEHLWSLAEHPNQKETSVTLLSDPTTTLRW